jgi:UDP-N-acetylmuramate dehydrogenase
MQIEENKPLAPYTTFGVGGPARWFVEAASEDEIVEATGWARERGLKLFVLGGGSNLLVADAGFDGLVLKVGLKGVRAYIDDHRLSVTRGMWIYEVAAGEDWDGFVQRTVEDNCAGLECLAGIPGTVGGTPVQNVGAYGQEVGSRIDRVRTFDQYRGMFIEFTSEHCEFGYRRSRFNSEDRGRYIVTRVDYLLSPGGAPTVRYPDLQGAILEDKHGEEPTLVDVAAAVRRVRQGKGMLLVDGDPDCRSAGSFFKNPIVSEEQLSAIAVISGKVPPQFPAGTGAENARQVKVPAAWLIEQAGYSKGFRFGRAGVSSRHTLALVNLGGASAEEILALAGQIRGAVHARFGLRLEMEPAMVGF